jgi:colicin import membrane protein
VYWSTSCGPIGTASSRHCSEGGELVYEDSCKRERGAEQRDPQRNRNRAEQQTHTQRESELTHTHTEEREREERQRERERAEQRRQTEAEWQRCRDR